MAIICLALFNFHRYQTVIANCKFGVSKVGGTANHQEHWKNLEDDEEKGGVLSRKWVLGSSKVALEASTDIFFNLYNKI